MKEPVIVVHVKGNCGATHPTLEEWRACEVCERMGKEFSAGIHPMRLRLADFKPEIIT